MGIGGNGCGALPFEEFILDEGHYEYSFLIRPYDGSCGDLGTYGRVRIPKC